jgi:hypothetical protein
LLGCSTFIIGLEVLLEYFSDLTLHIFSIHKTVSSGYFIKPSRYTRSIHQPWVEDEPSASSSGRNQQKCERNGSSSKIIITIEATSMGEAASTGEVARTGEGADRRRS